MAEQQVVVLNEGVSRLEVPAAADTYWMPRTTRIERLGLGTLVPSAAGFLKVDTIEFADGTSANTASAFGVTSVFGRVGIVVAQAGDYTASDVGLGNVDNTTDLLKPISTATQTALDAKVAETSSTGSAVMPTGTTAQRDGTPAVGYQRWNTTTTSMEVWDGAAWSALGGGGALNMPVVAHAVAYTALLSDKGKALDCTGTWTLGLTAAATLGDGWTLAVNNSGIGLITVDPNGTETIGGSLTYVVPAGYSVLIGCDGIRFVIIAAKGMPQVIHVQDQEAAGTQGGASAVGRNIRTLNTVLTNSIAGASLSTNQITLPVGTYDIEASAPQLSASGHQLYLRNTTDSTDDLIGTSQYSQASDVTQNRAFLRGRITITATKVFQIEHFIQTARGLNGLGAVNNSGILEVYAEIWVEKVG